MANFCGESDAAVEQLYDELMARIWAIHDILGTAGADVTRADVAARLAAVALTHVRNLSTGGVQAEIALSALLWPSGARPIETDPWWSTPLGHLIDKTARERASTRHAQASDAICHLVAS